MEKKLSKAIIISLILGIFAGIAIPNFMNSISFIGNIYINLLKFMIIPIISTTILVAVYKSTTNKSKILGKTISIFLVMFITSFLITTIIVLLLNPAANFKFQAAEWTGGALGFNPGEILTNLFPSNLITMLQNNAIFPTIIFSSLCGFAASKIKKGKIVIDFVDTLREIFSLILDYIMYLTPIGVFSLIGVTIANNGMSVIELGATYIGIAYLSSLIVVLVVMILPVWIYAKINPFEYIKKTYKVWLISASTCSSTATLPYTIRVCNKEFGVPERITNIVVPLGCTIHMCGGAVSFALLGLFTASLYGVQVTAGVYLLMLLSSTLINMAAPGIPNGGVVIGGAYLQMLGMPLTFIGFYRGIYKLLDMAYTTLNVTGDITANILINSFQKKQ